MCPPLADLVDDRDVGEEVMVLCGCHGFPQNFAALEVTHQNAQAVQVRMLRCDDLKNGLGEHISFTTSIYKQTKKITSSLCY